jgi:hypothetical protein
MASWLKDWRTAPPPRSLLSSPSTRKLFWREVTPAKTRFELPEPGLATAGLPVVTRGVVRLKS